MMPVVRVGAGRDRMVLSDRRAAMAGGKPPGLRRGTADQVAAPEREDGPRFRKGRIMADHQPDPAGRNVEHGPIMARRRPAPVVAVEVDLAVAADETLR